ncbi:MAG: D-alanyl-D-alanine carboxypeptidase [Deltaproteobacteria bacterium]|nr:D-alanyl-D-alanine carboxypeptidase [Deltaproteobacteria bacterium]
MPKALPAQELGVENNKVTELILAANTKRPSSKILQDAAKLPWPQNVEKMAGAGAVLVTDNYAEEGKRVELFSLNAEKDYIPASILKLVTAMVSLEVLGPQYRFQTDFYLDPDDNLWIVGRGDPFLVSEELCLIAQSLVERGLQAVNDIYLDTSYFEAGLVLDGTTYTINPYDAFNGALSVNFNTVTYLIDKKGQIVEYDQFTPLTPITKQLAEENRPKKNPRKVKEYRINISESPLLAEQQAGQFFSAILSKFGIEVNGEVITGNALPAEATPIYSHANSHELQELLAVLLEHSNNFMTNQIFLSMGAEVYGAPATMEKGLQVIYDYLAARGLDKLNIVEASGLSRNNTITAKQMSELLAVFEPFRHLIKSDSEGAVMYKTGTMVDIQTLAGYLIRPDRPDEPLSLVILLNGSYPNGTREKILEALKAHFIPNEDSTNS